ncbi:MAG: helix-turn-helix domain-containing protein [Anaerolineales bacterium]
MNINPLAMEIRARKLGILLRNAREAAHKTKDEAAEILGITAEEVEAFEIAQASPSLPQLEALANFYGVLLTHFWDNHLLEENHRSEILDLKTIGEVRQRIIGAALRKCRMEKELDIEKLAQALGIQAQEIEAFEFGEQPIPLPVLEGITQILEQPLDLFVDRDTGLGKRLQLQERWAGFQSLPEELQEFLAKPINRPYLQLAQRLSEMSVEKLRAVAEGLLEITL